MKCRTHTKAVDDNLWITVGNTTLHQHKLYYCTIALICHIVNSTSCVIRSADHQHFTERRSASGNRQNLKNKNRGAVLNNRALKLKATDTVQLPFCYLCGRSARETWHSYRRYLLLHNNRLSLRAMWLSPFSIWRVYSSSSKSIKSPASGSSDLIYNNWKSNKTTHKIYNYIMMNKPN